MMRFWGILGPPSYGIGATFRIGREMLCLPYAGFLYAAHKCMQVKGYELKREIPLTLQILQAPKDNLR